jgi:prevent-host-death family protein
LANLIDWSDKMTYTESVPTINASKFKEQCLSLLNRVGPEGILITKHGKPVARLVSAGTAPGELIGALKGKLRIKGDILSTGTRWNAQP